MREKIAFGDGNHENHENYISNNNSNSYDIIAIIVIIILGVSWTIILISSSSRREDHCGIYHDGGFL